MNRIAAHAVAIVATALLLVGPLATSAIAKDYCITDGVSTWIGRAFRIPGKNRCSAWQGFVLSLAGGGGGRKVCSGTACTSAVGDEMRVTMTCASTYASAVEIVAFSIDPATKTGAKYETLPDIGPAGGGPLTFSSPVSAGCLTSFAIP
jgi:hypothetical protein